MARRYSKEFKERAVRLTAEHQQVHSCKRWPAAEAVALKLGISPHTLMDWIRQDDTRAKNGDDTAVDYAEENARLRAENIELRRVNELLKEASAFFASELDHRARK